MGTKQQRVPYFLNLMLYIQSQLNNFSGGSKGDIVIFCGLGRYFKDYSQLSVYQPCRINHCKKIHWIQSKSEWTLPKESKFTRWTVSAWLTKSAESPMMCWKTINWSISLKETPSKCSTMHSTKTFSSSEENEHSSAKP